MNTCALIPMLALALSSAAAQPYEGVFQSATAAGMLTLRIETTGSQITGLLEDGVSRLEVRAERQVDGGAVGQASGPGVLFAFRADPGASGALTVQLAPVNAFGQPDMMRASVLQFAAVNPADVGAVFINRHRLTEERLAAIKTQYGVDVPAGRYWYDRASGGWGVESGPTLGFVSAQLDLPGPMPADISGGGTGIFINGREIHPMDQMALTQMLGGTIPGRYYLDARGNLGPEGGQPLVNLLAVSQANAASGQGGVYSGMGGTVGTDGSGGVLFYSRTASGGYQSYSN